MYQSSSICSMLGQWVASHCSLGRGESGVGGKRETRIGMWSEPVDGREVASHWWSVGKRWELPNAKSMALCRCEPQKGKRV